MNGIEIREYLMSQDHVFMISSEAEQLTVDLLGVIERAERAPSERHVSARVMFPLNSRYGKAILTRARNEWVRWRAARADQIATWNTTTHGPVPSYLTAPGAGPFNPATVSKHKRIEEVEQMYDYIDFLQSQV